MKRSKQRPCETTRKASGCCGNHWKLKKTNRGRAVMLIQKALSHINAIHPSVVCVEYDDDLRWNYKTATGHSVVFNKEEDIGLLEDAADEAYSLGKTNINIFLEANEIAVKKS